MKKHLLGKHFGGWTPPLPDGRDLKFQLTPLMASAVLPASVDMRPQMPPVYDQGDLGSCTANAAAAVFEFDMLAQKVPNPFQPSRLFIYYNERSIDKDVKVDAGSSLRTAAKALAKYGVCDEAVWPYNVKKFATKAPHADYIAAAKHKSVLYKAIDNSNLLLVKSCLAQMLPIMCGFTVYASFESDAVASSGMVPMPVLTGRGREQVLGGHAVVLVGYDDSKQCFLVRNSWGTSWGLAGYFYVPYLYFTNTDLADDFWQVSTITG